jgi:hypothetical protein
VLREYIAGLGLINALPGKWDGCTSKARQTPVGLGISNG